jgi:hypothetical protein
MCEMNSQFERSEFERRPLRRPTAGATLAACALLLAGSWQLCQARAAGQSTFSSPDEASRALFSAVQKHDERALNSILGAGSELVSSDDEAQDTLDREQFVQKYQQMHRLVDEPGGVAALYIGAENWPFPIPLVSRNGAWRFDSAGGANEIRFRRIGENEVTAIGMCHALVAAETRPGTNNEADGFVRTLLPHIQDADKPIPFHGYYFRMRSSSAGKFAAVAYPVVYGSSGVMTFIVNEDDGVFEKDLGPDTAKVATAMRSYRPDATWVASASDDVQPDSVDP